MRNAVLHNFQTVLPRVRVPQAVANEWLATCHSLFEARHAEKENASRVQKVVHRYCVKDTQIASRWVECPDALKSDWENHEVYFLNSAAAHGADGLARNLLFSNRALEVFREFYPSTESLPDHLIHVSCTGYFSPSAPQVLVAQKPNTKPTEITHAYHMGCYAAFPAARIAAALSADRQVDIVHTEMCSLHLNPLDHTPEQVIVQSLFGDGHVKYSVGPEPIKGSGLKIVSIRETVVPDSGEDMTWVPSSWGMRMTLSRNVPDKIKTVIPDVLTALCQSSGHDLDDLRSRAIFAVHPGGPKIIESVQEALGLRDDQVSQSKKVLFERGNMSSATLPHIWKEILNGQAERGTPVVSFAFGPGLTVFSAIFEVSAP